MNNQFSGSNFEGTPISQLMNDNGMMGMTTSDFGNFPPVTNPQGPPNQPSPNMLFQQPSRDIRNMVHNINNRIENDVNNIRDNVSFDLSNHSMDSSDSSSKKKFIKYMKNKHDIDEKKKKLKKLKKKKMKEIESKDNEDEDEDEEKSDYIAFYNIGKHFNKETKELLLLVLIYCILSMGFIKKSVGGYISYINPDETGKYSYVGVIIYGILLAILFISFRKIII